MDDKSISSVLRELSADYYHNHIGLEDYRKQRKIILDNIDLQINGKQAHHDDAEDTGKSGLFMQTIAFLQNQDVE